MDACNQFLGKCTSKQIIYSHFPLCLKVEVYGTQYFRNNKVSSY